MLPVHEILPQLKAALAARTAAVLVAPPGAGKTTVAPLELLDEPWLAGRRIIMLEPRRLAAAPVVESQGRAFTDANRYLGRDDRLRLEEQVVRAVERALAEEVGSVLV